MITVAVLAIYQHILRATFAVIVAVHIAARFCAVKVLTASVAVVRPARPARVAEQHLLALVPNLRAVVELLPIAATITDSVIVEPFLCAALAIPRKRVVAVAVDSFPACGSVVVVRPVCVNVPLAVVMS
jgi:hypothetical protein